MDFMNRKLFKQRPARDKLNQLGGIMASSQPLMQTVQQFQVGGSVDPSPRNPNFFNNFQTIPRQFGLGPQGQARSFMAQIPTREANRAKLEEFDRQTIVNPLMQLLSGRRAFDAQALVRPTTEVQIEAGQTPTMRGPTAEDVREMQQTTEAENVAESERLGSELLRDLTPDSFMMPGVTPSPDREEREAGEAGEGVTAGAAIEPPVTPPVTTEGEAAVQDPAAEVTRVFNEGTPEEVGGQLETLMNEFTSKAPQFEGMNKGLALAKIGFAMAAGQSPNAVTNIANALSEGADAFIKDNKDKAAFDRQVKLSALQYGLTEIGKERAEERTAAREGRALKTFIADAPVTIEGRTYEAGDPVAVSVDYIRKNGIPSELTTPELIKAAQERQSATAKSLDELIKAGTLTNKDARAEAELYQNSVGNVIGAETAINLLENSLVNVAEGKVTGLAPAFRNVVRQGGSFFGIDMGSEYKDVDEARAAMRFALQQAIPVTVGSTQSANSISDRDVDLLITAMFGQDALTGGPFTFATDDPDLMGQRLQRAIQQIRTGQKSEIANMQAVESRLSTMYAPGSSRVSGVTPAIQQLAPFQRQFEEAGFTARGRPTRTTVGLVQVREEDGIPVFDFYNR